MTNGPVFGKIIRFSIPLMLTGLLQLFYHAADMIVVGRFSGSDALAAVGSTSSLTQLIINVFMGLSVGTSVAVAQSLGAKDNKAVSDTVHTSISIGLICGVFVALFGFFMSKTFLVAMDTPLDIIEKSTIYMKIHFLGIPASMLYNFSASILRAAGDTKRPLIFLGISGLVNVGLNLVFVIGFSMSVVGVALGTIISQYLSVIMVLICLIKSNKSYKLDIKKLKIHKEKLFKIIRIGVPAGLQSSLFSISNVFIQSSINSFGSSAIAGNTAASNLESFVYMAMNALQHAAITFTGQNVGAKKPERIKKVCASCTLLTTIVGVVLGGLVYIVFSKPLLRIYIPADEAAVAVGIIRLSIIGVAHFICGIMEVMVGTLRGMGQSLVPMLVSVIGVCGLRIIWIYTIFAQWKTLESLYLSYPVTWILTALVQFICVIIIKNRLTKKINKETPVMA